MTPDQLEFSIAQYADGTLPPAERAALEAVLAGDADARALLAEYRALDAALKAGPAALPADVRWDALAGQIGDAAAKLPAPGEPAVPADVEFALAQYADGTLGEAGRPAVESRIASDPAARVLVGEYEAVDAFVKSAVAPLPAVRWDALANHIAAAVEAHASDAGGMDEAAEFAVAQYADGTLPADERDAVEAQLTADAGARITLAEYGQLDRMLKGAAAADPLPAVRWDALAAHLSAVVAEEADRNETREAEQDEQRSRRFKLFAWAKPVRAPAWAALAASVAIAVGVGWRLLHHTPAGPTVARTDVQVGPPGRAVAVAPAAGPAVVEVVVLQPTDDDGRVIVAPPAGGSGPAAAIVVAVGPSYPDGEEPDARWADVGIGDDFVRRPSRVIVASGLDRDSVEAPPASGSPF